MELVRDRLWIWGLEAGCHRTADWNIPEPSRITPVEGAHYMGIPNIIMVRIEGKPVPPYRQYAIPFRSLKQVVWSIVGAGGVTADEDRKQALELTKVLPNMTGVMMDDFFTNSKNPNDVGVLSIEELQNIRKLLHTPEYDLDLWVVLYSWQLEQPVQEHLKLCDKLTFWTWCAKDLEFLEENFAKMKKLAPSPKKYLGCYFYDFGDKREMPLDLMKKQCELGLKWLKEGRIDGIIYVASCNCDLELEAVEWTKKWIEKVGKQKI